MKAKAVNITLKDGTRINKCWVFEKGEKGQYSIQDEEKINQLFQVYPWGNEWRYVFFQTSMMNGNIPVVNVDTYEIVEVE